MSVLINVLLDSMLQYNNRLVSLNVHLDFMLIMAPDHAKINVLMDSGLISSKESACLTAPITAHSSPMTPQPHACSDAPLTPTCTLILQLANVS